MQTIIYITAVALISIGLGFTLYSLLVLRQKVNDEIDKFNSINIFEEEVARKKMLLEQMEKDYDSIAIPKENDSSYPANLVVTAAILQGTKN